jgi:hypothetical protein
MLNVPLGSATLAPPQILTIKFDGFENDPAVLFISSIKAGIPVSAKYPGSCFALSGETLDSGNAT